MSTLTRPFSVDELVRAHRAVLAGEFRRHRTPQAHPRWDPDGPVLPVLGAAGGCGATTLALALATAAGAGRVVECVPPTASGLSAAPTAELGAHRSGWVRGTRGAVVIERVAAPVASAGEVPVPAGAEQSAAVTVVDVGWALPHVQGGSCWLTDLLATAPVVVVAATATIPGLRALETTLHLLRPDLQVAAAVLGPPRRRWPRGVHASTGPATRALIDTGRLVTVPSDPHLGIRGIDTAALPSPLLAAAGDLLDLFTELTSTPGRDLLP